MLRKVLTAEASIKISVQIQYLTRELTIQIVFTPGIKTNSVSYFHFAVVSLINKS